MNKIRKNFVSIFKSTDFKVEITTNLGEVNFLVVTFNFEKKKIKTYRQYKKLNDNMTYINTSSNYPPQIIKHLTQTIRKSSSRNSSSPEIFKQSKPD